MATAEAVETETARDGHSHSGHPEWLAHHFESPQQQFEAGKLGVWLFLAQEVLFFTGLFVAYAVYRMNHPAVFSGAAEYLNTTLGTLNTVVLLASSLAVAWAVRCVQLNQQKMLLWLHIFTLGCAGVFMGVKVVEYAYKFDEGLYWYGSYAPAALVAGEGLNAKLQEVFLVLSLIGGLIAGGGYLMHETRSGLGAALVRAGWGLVALVIGAAVATGLGASSGVLYWLTTLFSGALAAGVMALFVAGFRGDRAAWGAVAVGLGMCIIGTAAGVVVGRSVQAGVDHGHHGDQQGAHGAGDHGGGGFDQVPAELPSGSAAGASAAEQAVVNQGNFFSIYFAMTGVHALHILAGIAVIAWIIGRIARGDFSPDFYGPVEFVGLYWHLVDLVWIYLFPLLYLIH